MRWCESQPLVSLLVPFREGNDPQRIKTWRWLKKFYANSGYNFEIVVGTDDGTPFSKSTAINNAAKKARGKVFVVLDSDCYTDPAVIQKCAEEIIAAEKCNRKLWFVPYLHLYRLTKEITTRIINTNPCDEYNMPYPPPESWTEPGSSDRYGHRYGAMILIMSSKAFWTVGGMDQRFRGWGSEDMSFMISLDTVYSLHETVDNAIFHLWHLRPTHSTFRHWPGQRVFNVNVRLGQRYGIARGDVTFMKALIKERYNPSCWDKLHRCIKKQLIWFKCFFFKH